MPYSKSRFCDESGWSAPILVAAAAIVVAVAVAAYPIYVKAVGRARMQVLHSDIKSWVDRVEFLRAADGTLPPSDQLAALLAASPALLEEPNSVTVWPDCRLTGDAGGVAPSRGEFVVVAAAQVPERLAGAVTPIVYDTVSGGYTETGAAPLGETGCSLSAGGEGSVVAVASPGETPPVVTPGG